MSLLRQIQEAALDSSVPLADTLRRCKLLAARLQNDELSRWVDDELNGYVGKADKVPDYRRIQCVSVGTFLSPTMVRRGVPIPSLCLPEDMREFAEFVSVGQSVAALDSLLRAPNAEQGVSIPWPADLVALVQTDIQEGAVLQSAKHSLSVGVLAGILDTVRTRLLEFAIAIEKENPEAGEASVQGKPPVTPERVQQIVNVTIYGGQQSFGDGATFNVAGRDLVISSAFSPEQQDQLKGLLTELHDHLASVTDADDKEDAAQALQKVETELAKAEPQPGRLKRWLGTYASVVGAAAGTVKVIEQVVEFLM